MTEPPEIETTYRRKGEPLFPPYWPKMAVGVGIGFAGLAFFLIHPTSAPYGSGIILGFIVGASVGGMIAIIFKRWL